MIEVRDRMSRGNLRLRTRRQLGRSLRSLGILLVTLGVGAACAAYLLGQIDRTVLVGSRTYAFAVGDATAVDPGVDELRFKGIPAGKISGVALRGTEPVITVQLESGFGRIYRNATAELRPNTPLQDMYLDITSPGTPDAGAAGVSDPLPAAQTSTSVNISDVLDVFAAPERTRLSELLAALGNGLSDRGQALREAFVQAVPFIVQAGRFSAQLEHRSRLTEQLVHNLGVLTSTLGQRATGLRTLVADGSRVMATVGGRSVSVARALEQLPGTISTADSALAAVGGVLPAVNGAVRSLYPVADVLPAALRSIRGLSRTARPAVSALRRPVAQLVALARALVPVSSALASSVTTLLPQVPTLNRALADVGGCLPSLYGFFAWNASMAKFGDVRGGAPRGNAVIGAQSAGLGNPAEFRESACTGGQAIGGRLPKASDYR
jgi:ABC-type transporter Mla subunit MlaD